MKNVICTLLTLVAIFSMVLANPQKANADSAYSRSSLYWGTFLGDAPFVYTYQGAVRVDYRRSGDWYQLQKVDMSGLIYQAGRFNNPLEMVGSIDVEVYQNGRRVATLYPNSAGSYIYSPNDVLFGGVSYPNYWIVGRPTFKANMSVLARGGFGGYSRSWTFGL